MRARTSRSHYQNSRTTPHPSGSARKSWAASTRLTISASFVSSRHIRHRRISQSPKRKVPSWTTVGRFERKERPRSAAAKRATAQKDRHFSHGDGGQKNHLKKKIRPVTSLAREARHIANPVHSSPRLPRHTRPPSPRAQIPRPSRRAAGIYSRNGRARQKGKQPPLTKAGTSPPPTGRGKCRVRPGSKVKLFACSLSLPFVRAFICTGDAKSMSISILGSPAAAGYDGLAGLKRFLSLNSKNGCTLSRSQARSRV